LFWLFYYLSEELSVSQNRFFSGYRALDEPFGPQICGGDGVRLVLGDGRSVLDATSMGHVAVLGHRHPDLVAAIQRAADAPFVKEGYEFASREETARALLDVAFAGEDWVGGVRFTCCASDAGDLALSLAQLLTGRAPLVTRELSYHGGFGLARDVSASHPLWFGGLASNSGGTQLPRMGAPVRLIPSPVCGVSSTNCAGGCCHGCLDSASSILQGAAAFIDDFGSGGVFPSADFQDALAAKAREAGALWVQDEAVTGMGRTGRWFAFQRGRQRPDMVILGKAVTGGATPGGALVVSKQVLHHLKKSRWALGCTVYGHPLVVAAVTAAVGVIERDALVQRSAELGSFLGSRLAELASNRPSIRRVAGEGLYWVIELEGSDADRTWRGDGRGPRPAHTVVEAALDWGVMLAAVGGLLVQISPPAISKESDIEDMVSALEHGLVALEEERETESSQSPRRLISSQSRGANP
jgi:4-aminobutyrate aminotransferase-like enzyme